MRQLHESWCLPGRQDSRRSRPHGQWPRRIALLLAVSALALGPGCRRKVDAAEQIRALVRGVAKAATERDLGEVIAPLAEDFRADVGAGLDEGEAGIDRQQLKLLLLRYLRRPVPPRVLIRSIDVTVEGEQARAEVMALLSQGGADLPSLAVEPARAEALKLELQLEHRDDRWWVVHARRTPIDPKRLIVAQ